MQCIIIYDDEFNHILLSWSWLKVTLKKLHLKRRSPDPNYDITKALVRKILETSDKLKGYRGIWKLLWDRYGYIVRRYVRFIVVIIIGVQWWKFFKKWTLKGWWLEKREGSNKDFISILIMLIVLDLLLKVPNYVWHMDGYNKLYICDNIKDILLPH